MIYDLRHLTTYHYAAPVSSARCALRLIPRQDYGQTLIHQHLSISPVADESFEREDFFGNRVVRLRIETPHKDLSVTSTVRIRIDRTLPSMLPITPPWEDVRHEAMMSQDLGPRSPVHHLFPSRLIVFHKAVTDYARQSFSPQRPLLEAAIELMQRIKQDFKYDPTATVISTPIAQTFEKRMGVCQDFAHLMIAALRGMGLPAAYVSGYIRTIPPPGQPRLEGADASHAWVSVWAGQQTGWFDLDPTNAIQLGEDHIVLAIGRDYADVSPLDGIILGTGDQKLDVQVDVIPVPENPATTGTSSQA